MRDPIIDQPDVAFSQQTLFARHAWSVTFVTGIIFFLGTVIDFLTLWVLQREPGLQWEFVATTQTAEGVPRLILGLGLMYVALYLKGSSSVAAYRLLGSCLLALGLGALGLGVLVAMNYLSMVASVNVEALSAFRTTTLKSASLTALYAVTLIPLGVRGLRIPR